MAILSPQPRGALRVGLTTCVEYSRLAMLTAHARAHTHITRVSLQCHAVRYSAATRGVDWARSLTVGEAEVAPPSLVKLVVVFGSVHGCVETGGDARLREGRGPLLGEHALETVPV